jgi:hypothetical protein
MPQDDGTVITPVTLAMIHALIPLGLRAVEDALLAEIQTLAGPRYARDDARSAVTLSTHSAGGITGNDIALAREMEKIAGQ